MSSKQKEFFNEAEAYGVSSGLGLPIPVLDDEPGIVSFVSSACSSKEVAQIMGDEHLELALLGTSFHHAAVKFFEKQPSPIAPDLTKREIECLKWAAIGKTDVDIGMILGISHRTVSVHLQSAYRKLNCSSREQAVVTAILMRIISL